MIISIAEARRLMSRGAFVRRYDGLGNEIASADSFPVLDDWQTVELEGVEHVVLNDPRGDLGSGETHHFRIG